MTISPSMSVASAVSIEAVFSISSVTSLMTSVGVTNLSWHLLRHLPWHLDRDLDQSEVSIDNIDQSEDDLGAVLLRDVHTVFPRHLDWLLEGNLLAGMVRHLLTLLVRHLDQSEMELLTNKRRVYLTNERLVLPGRGPDDNAAWAPGDTGAQAPALARGCSGCRGPAIVTQKC